MDLKIFEVYNPQARDCLANIFLQTLLDEDQLVIGFEDWVKSKFFTAGILNDPMCIL